MRPPDSFSPAPREKFCSFGITESIAAGLIAAGVGEATAGTIAAGVVGAGALGTGGAAIGAIEGGGKGALTGFETGALTGLGAGLGSGLGGAFGIGDVAGAALGGAAGGALGHDVTGGNPLTGAIGGGIQGAVGAELGGFQTPTAGAAGAAGGGVAATVAPGALEGGAAGSSVAGFGDASTIDLATLGGGYNIPEAGVAGVSGESALPASAIPTASGAALGNAASGAGYGFGGSLAPGTVADPLSGAAATPGAGANLQDFQLASDVSQVAPGSNAQSGAGFGFRGQSYTGTAISDPNAAIYAGGPQAQGGVLGNVLGTSNPVPAANTISGIPGEAQYSAPIGPIQTSGVGNTLGIGGSGAPAVAGTGGTAGGNAADAGWFARNSNWLLPAAGLTANAVMSQRQLPYQSNITSAAGTIGTTGQDLLNQYNSGTLPPGMQAVIDQQKQAAIAQIRSQYANMGIADSTMSSQAEAAAAEAAVAQTTSVLANMLNAGMSATQTAANIYQQLQANALAQDQQLGQAIGQFAAAAAGGGPTVQLKVA